MQLSDGGMTVHSGEGDGAGRPREAGFILVLVIWIALLLSILVMGLAWSGRSHLRLTSSRIESAKAEAVADAGAHLAVLWLAAAQQDPAVAPRLPVDGTPRFCSLPGRGMVALSVQDEGGRVNLNLAQERTLAVLFAGLGADPEQATRMADLIADYRDADEVRRPSGAEKPEYAAAGRTLGPRNAPFDTVAELHQVLGVDHALVAAAIPYLTVHSTSAGLDPQTVSPALAAVIRHGASVMSGRIVIDDAIAAALPKEMQARSRRRDFRITSFGHAEGGAMFVREAAVELGAGGLPTFKAWLAGGTSPPAPPETAPPPC